MNIMKFSFICLKSIVELEQETTLISSMFLHSYILGNEYLLTRSNGELNSYFLRVFMFAGIGGKKREGGWGVALVVATAVTTHL